MSYIIISGNFVALIFLVPWLLPLFFLISGFIITAGPLLGIRVYSRRQQPALYWWNLFLLCAVIAVVEALYKRLLDQ